MFVFEKSLDPIHFHALKIFDYTASGSTSSSLATIEVPPSAGHPEAWSTRSDKSMRGRSADSQNSIARASARIMSR